MEPIQCFLIEPIFGEFQRTVSCERNVFGEFQRIVSWERKDTGESHINNSQFGPGAIWWAIWLPKNFDWDNETEPHLIVRCPGGRDWDIDSRCSNCGKREDRSHRCWVRHGAPPVITVDKNGDTCPAGAGSIALPNWHGFLRNGYLVQA